MSNDKIFVNGMIVKPSKYATKVAIKVSEFSDFMATHGNKGWLNIEIKTSQGGKMYAALDTWQPADRDTGEIKNTPAPAPQPTQPSATDDLPF